MALLRYMKPVCCLPDHRGLLSFSHVTNSTRVSLTHMQLDWFVTQSDENITRRRRKFPDLQ